MATNQSPSKRTCLKKGCNLQFAKWDNHPLCYTCRDCGKTGSPLGNGKSCRYCADWSPPMNERFAKLYKQRQRQRAHAANTPALRPISSSVSEPRKKTPAHPVMPEALRRPGVTYAEVTRTPSSGFSTTTTTSVARQVVTPVTPTSGKKKDKRTRRSTEMASPVSDRQGKISVVHDHSINTVVESVPETTSGVTVPTTISVPITQPVTSTSSTTVVTAISSSITSSTSTTTTSMASMPTTTTPIWSDIRVPLNYSSSGHHQAIHGHGHQTTYGAGNTGNTTPSLNPETMFLAIERMFKESQASMEERLCRLEASRTTTREVHQPMDHYQHHEHEQYVDAQTTHGPSDLSEDVWVTKSGQIIPSHYSSDQALAMLCDHDPTEPVFPDQDNDSCEITSMSPSPEHRRHDSHVNVTQHVSCLPATGHAESHRHHDSPRLQQHDQLASVLASGALKHMLQMPDAQQWQGLDQAEVAEAFNDTLLSLRQRTSIQPVPVECGEPAPPFKEPPAVTRAPQHPASRSSRQEPTVPPQVTDYKIPNGVRRRSRSRSRTPVLSRVHGGHADTHGWSRSDRDVQSRSQTTRQDSRSSPRSRSRSPRSRSRRSSPRRDSRHESPSSRYETRRTERIRRSRSLSPRFRQTRSESREAQSDLSLRSASEVRSVQLEQDQGSPPREQEISATRRFRQTVKLLLSDDSAIKPASDPGPLRYPEDPMSSLGKPSEKPDMLPPHACLSSWYNYAQATLKESDPPSKKGDPYSVQSVHRRKSSVYNCGKEGEFLLGPRTAPQGFKELSNFTQQDQVRKTLANGLTLNPKTVKTVDRSLRTGISAASYGAHFLDGASRKLDQITDLAKNLSAPPDASSASRRAVDDQKEALLEQMESLATFLESARTCSFDSVGCLIDMDVNLALVQRDKLVSRLRSYLVHHTPTLRHDEFMSKELMPSMAKISEKARDDATQESTRQLAAGNYGKGRGQPHQYDRRGTQSEQRGGKNGGKGGKGSSFNKAKTYQSNQGSYQFPRNDSSRANQTSSRGRGRSNYKPRGKGKQGKPQ